MNNKFIFFLLLLKVSLQWTRCYDKSSLAIATNRVSHTATAVGDDFYLIGGVMDYGQNVKRPNVYIYKVTYNTCKDIKVELKKASVDIYDHAAAYIPDGEFKDCILIFGGNNMFKEEYESIFYYNISSDSIGNITSAEFTYVGSRAYYIKDLNKVALIGGYNEENIHNSISYFDLNTQEIESYNDNIGFDPAKRHSFSSSLNEIEDKDGNKRNIITFFGGYNKYNDYTKSLFTYDTTTPTERPLQKHFDGPDLNREYTKGIGWKNYLVFHGGTFYYSNSFYLSERTLLYDIKNNKMLEVKDERFGVWRHDNVIIKDDLLIVVGGSGTKTRVTDFFVLNLTTSSLKKAEEDVFNPLMYYLIGAASVVFVGICMCCCLYCVLSNIARRRYERQAIGIERMLNGEPPRNVPEDLLNVMTKDTYTAHKFHQQTCCTICILEFEEGDKIKVLPCQHIFHPECIDQWLRTKDICPVCKREVLNERGSRIALTIAWEENNVDEISIKQNDNPQQQQLLQNQQNDIEMGSLNNHKTSKDSVTINVAPQGSGTNLPRVSSPNRLSTPNRTSTPNTASRRRDVVTPNSISVQNNSGNNSVNNSVHFQPPNMPFEDMSQL